MEFVAIENLVQDMDEKRIRNMNTTSLAFVGDAIYESYIRLYIIGKIQGGADRLHRATVRYVRADAQAYAIKQLMDKLSEVEQRLVKRARNKRSMTKAKNTDPITYKWATAFEALVGYLYLSGEIERMEEIIEAAIGSVGQRNDKEKSKK